MINALMQDVDLRSLHSELRGITDAVEDLQYDHLSMISSLTSVAQGIVKRLGLIKSTSIWTIEKSLKILMNW